MSAAARSQAAQISWTAPASDGGSAITSYRITPYIGSAAQPATTVAAPAESATVSGLNNGTTYTFTVTAVNGVGSGPASAPSGSVVPRATIFEQAVPAVVEESDSNAVELGVKFSSDVPGQVRGVRFYKSAGNTGPHLVSLWSGAGALLAQATATGETAFGWQEVPFASPVTIAASTTYVASYFAPTGHYSATGQGLSNAVDSPPLHALSNTSSPNGVFAYSPTSTFPANSFNSTNYWVDVLFTP